MDSSPDTIRCPRCRKDLPAGTSFCRRCGAELPGAWPEPSPQAGHGHIPSHHRPDGPRGSGDGAWRVLLAAAVLALGFALALALWVTRRSRGPHVATARQTAPVLVSPLIPRRAPMSVTPLRLPLLPPLTAWHRHLPADLPPADGGPDYRGQILPQGRFGSLPLSDVIFAGADLLQSDFERADVDGADFRGADLSQADFGGADLAGAKFDEARVHQTQFVGADTAAVAGSTEVRDGIVEPVPPPRLTAKHVGQASFRMAAGNPGELRWS